MMIGCVTAITKTTRENGATVCIPGSHTWGPERCPLDEEAIPAELEPGSALIFVGNLYHAGGANVTKYAEISSLRHDADYRPGTKLERPLAYSFASRITGLLRINS
jgi:ectoine hydroxylase-related dioxygenase (phytanoyl-CoA dioxygenase family)